MSDDEQLQARKELLAYVSNVFEAQAAFRRNLYSKCGLYMICLGVFWTAAYALTAGLLLGKDGLLSKCADLAWLLTLAPSALVVMNCVPVFLLLKKVLAVQWTAIPGCPSEQFRQLAEAKIKAADLVRDLYGNYLTAMDKVDQVDKGLRDGLAAVQQWTLYCVVVNALYILVLLWASALTR